MLCLMFASDSWSVSPKKRRFLAGEFRAFTGLDQPFLDSSSVVIMLSFSIWNVKNIILRAGR